MTHRAVPHSTKARRHRCLSFIASIGLAFALPALTGCGSFSGSDGVGPAGGSGARGPEVRILAPVGGQRVTGSTVRVQLLVRGARLVDKVGQPNVEGEGHLRVWVDTEDTSAQATIQTTPTFELTGLVPGLHHFIVELRHNDGSPLHGTPTDVERDTPVHKHVHFDTISALSRIQTEIFTPMCATSGCHVAGGSAPMPLTDVVTSHRMIVDRLSDNGTARSAGKKCVAPGRPEQSFLLHKLTGEMQFGEGDPMPPAAPLTTAQIDLIRLWISQGAAPA